MKKLVCLLCLPLCGLVASAQPTSVGGITPGKTTLAELKGLVTQSYDSEDGRFDVRLKQLGNMSAAVWFQNGIVYQVNTFFDYSPEFEEALIAKYGEPTIKVGEIEIVKCQNKFGATFDRYQGQETQFWPAKDGVQGGLEYVALTECATEVTKKYVLSHVATVQAIEEKSEEDKRKNSEEKRRKLDGVL
jgi:hypothetical protein